MFIRTAHNGTSFPSLVTMCQFRRVRMCLSIGILVAGGLFTSTAWALDKDSPEPDAPSADTPGPDAPQPKSKSDVGVHIQTRAGWQQDSTTSPGFQVRRARLNGAWSIGQWSARLKVAGEEGRMRVLNAYLGWELDHRLSIDVGQQKRVTNLDYVIGSFEQRFYERSTIGNKVDSTRDIGVLFRSRWLKDRIDGHFAVFNGNGAGTSGNDNSDLRYEARLDIHLLREVKYERARIGKKPRVMIGAGFGTIAYDDPTTNDVGTQIWSRARRTTMSAVIVAQAFRHELRAEWVSRTYAALDPATGADAPSPDITNVGRDGGYVQWAWGLPVPVDVESSARLQLYRPTGAAGEQQVQVDVGGTWHLVAKTAKLSLHGWVLQGGIGTTSVPPVYGVTSQLQLRL